MTRLSMAFVSFLVLACFGTEGITQTLPPTESCTSFRWGQQSSAYCYTGGSNRKLIFTNNCPHNVEVIFSTRPSAGTGGQIGIRPGQTVSRTTSCVSGTLNITYCFEYSDNERRRADGRCAR